MEKPPPFSEGSTARLFHLEQLLRRAVRFAREIAGTMSGQLRNAPERDPVSPPGGPRLIGYVRAGIALRGIVGKRLTYETIGV